MGRLIAALSLNVVTNGVAVSEDRRIFMTIARFDGSDGARVAEYVDGELRSYPDSEWNKWTFGESGLNRFVRVNSIRLGPDGDLWLVDVGAPGIGKAKVRSGPKLVRIDPSINQVRRVYSLDKSTTAKSFIDDVRFNGQRAYITDAGDPAIIVLDLRTGRSRRVLEGDHSTTAHRPISADGQVIIGADGRPVFVHADQLEVSPDGNWLYFQPCSGPLYRVPTSLVDDPMKSGLLSRRVELFAETTCTGGTAIDAQGNIYASDTNLRRILKISPTGVVKTFLRDSALSWIDAMWIDSAGYLWMPAAQLDRLGPFQGPGGISRVIYPVRVYKTKVNRGPPPLDHR